MISAFLAVLAAGPLDGFDAANLALTSCGFAVFREANAANMPDGQFERSLAATCAQQIRALHRAIVAIEVARGESSSRAAAFADRQLARFRSDFRQQYAGRAETNSQMRALGRALEEEGSR